MMDRCRAQHTRTHEQLNEANRQLDALKRNIRAMQEIADPSGEVRKNSKTEVERRKDFNREKELLNRVCGLEASADSLKRQVAALEDRGTMPLTQSVTAEQRLLPWEQQPNVAAPRASELSNCVQTCQNKDQAANTQLVNQEMVPGIHEVTMTPPTTSQHRTSRQSRPSHKALSVSKIARTTANEKNALAVMQDAVMEEEYFSCDERAALSHRRRAARKAREAKARAMTALG